MGSEKITTLFTAEKKRQATTRGRGKAKGAVVQAVEAAPEKNNQDEYHLQILKTFDMTTKFGPALGLTRLERWERAEKLNLSPPADVYKILTEIDREGKWADCVWEKIV